MKQVYKPFGITSMVLGILSIVFCWKFSMCLVCGIVALVFGILYLYHEKMSCGMAIAGIATAAAGLILSALLCLLMIMSMMWGIGQSGSYNQGYDDGYEDGAYGYGEYYYYGDEQDSGHDFEEYY